MYSVFFVFLAVRRISNKLEKNSRLTVSKQAWVNYNCNSITISYIFKPVIVTVVLKVQLHAILIVIDTCVIVIGQM